MSEPNGNQQRPPAQPAPQGYGYPPRPMPFQFPSTAQSPTNTGPSAAPAGSGSGDNGGSQSDTVPPSPRSAAISVLASAATGIYDGTEAGAPQPPSSAASTNGRFPGGSDPRGVYMSPVAPHSATVPSGSVGARPIEPHHAQQASHSLPAMPPPAMPHPGGYQPYPGHYLPQSAGAPPSAFMPPPHHHHHLGGPGIPGPPGHLPTIGDSPPSAGGHNSAAAFASAASAGVSAAGVKKKTTRRYNASCDACRARKRKCPGRDPVTGQTLCTACGDRGVPCTYGNLGEPSRLRRADNENEKLKLAIREALEAGDMNEKDRILQSFLKNGGVLPPEVKSEGVDSGGDGTSASGTRRKRGGGQGGGRGGKKQRYTGTGYEDVSFENSAGGPAVHPPYTQFQGQYPPGPHSQAGGYGEMPPRGYTPGEYDQSQDQYRQQHYQPHYTDDHQPQQSEPPSSTTADVGRLQAANDGEHGSPRPVSSEGGTSAPAEFTSNTIAGLKPAEEEEDIHGIVYEIARAGLIPLAAQALNIDISEAEKLDDYTLQMAGCPTPEEEDKLLSYYFCWLNPRYSLLDEGLLRNGRERKDSLFAAPLLMWAVFGHVAVHCPGFQDKRKQYRARAHFLLGCEMSRGKRPALTTVQAMVLLSANAAAMGDHSMSWAMVHTIVAFVNDLLEGADNPTICGPEERVMRKRLYWSSYVWSLVMSLNLNRRPPMPKLRVDLPEPTENEKQIWTPVLPVRADDPPDAPGIIATPQPNNEIACHHQACMLFTFLDDILSNVYMASHDRKHVDVIYQSVRNIRDRMSAWQATIPAEILLDPNNLPAICPPPHIAHFNLMLRSTWILLYRPFYSMAAARNPIRGAREACDQCAREINALFVLFEGTFGVLRITFIYIYAAFWAATIDVAAAKRGGLRPDLLARLRYSSRILLTWVSLPGMKQSVSDLIEQIEALLVGDAPPPMPLPQGPPFTPFLTGPSGSNSGSGSEGPGGIQRTNSPSSALTAWQRNAPTVASYNGPVLPQPKMEDGSYGGNQNLYLQNPNQQMTMQYHQTIQGFADPSFTASPAAHQPNSELYWSLPSWTMW